MKYASIKHTAELYKEMLTEQALRNLIAKKEKNGIDECLIKLGKKIIIDLEKFNRWINKHAMKK